jgi:hypothetical protein
MRSGAHTDAPPGLYATDPYPQAWRQPNAPLVRGPIDEAMAAAAAVLVVPNDD